MLTKNIYFNNFNLKKKFNIKKKYFIFKKINWFVKFPLLKSYSEKYKYSYDKIFIKKLKKFHNVNCIGMGGSILGTKAIYNFLQTKIKKKFTFVDNLNPQINIKKNGLNIIISKSGETLETISNLNILLKEKKYKKNIFITEFTNNNLLNLAKKLKSEIIEHKNYIGGRYSVLSEVGMLPAELMGLNQKKFKQFNSLIKNKKFSNQLIYNVECIINLVKKGKKNSIILNYDSKSDYLFQWYQQLVGESLGKKSKGIIPIISSIPKDNHSLLQLYLDGPKNNFFTFYNVRDKISDKISSKFLSNSYKFLKNKSLRNILSAQQQATQEVFKKKKIPFRTFEMTNRSEQALGEFFCFFVLETILLGQALGVNPFDQPAVELIKVKTKRILS